MAVRRYRNTLKYDDAADVTAQTRIGVDESAGFAGGGPGEEFDFDYDRPGYSAQALIDVGAIELVDKTTKKEG